MIRAVRFAVKLGLDIETGTLAAIERHRCDLLKSSIPRLVEETYRTLTLPDADLALMLLQRLGLLELLLPFLTDHLSLSNLESARTVSNLARLGTAIGRGDEFHRGFILACLYADLHLQMNCQAPPPDRFAIVNALRERGFSKAETEHMRLLLEALAHMIKRSRNLRRLAKRPYFAEAYRLFALIAPSIDDDPTTLDQFLAGPPPRGHLLPPAISRRRRRRRGGRRRNHERASETAPAPAKNRSVVTE
jgi:poly(A) polymerase